MYNIFILIFVLIKKSIVCIKLMKDWRLIKKTAKSPKQTYMYENKSDKCLQYELLLCSF